MALVYFIDGSNDPVLNADAYTEVLKADLFLSFMPAWNILTTEQKEDKIKHATALVDSASYGGAPVSDSDEQTLQFPRLFEGTNESIFQIVEQKRRLLRATCAQIEYNLNRQGLGTLSFSRGDLSATISQETLCRPAKIAVSVYML